MDVSLCTQKIVYGTVGTAFPPCFFAWLVMFGKHWVERRDKQHLWDMISLFALRFREGITHRYLLWTLGWTYSGTTALILEYFSTFFPESSMSSLFLAYLFSSPSPLSSHAKSLKCKCASLYMYNGCLPQRPQRLDGAHRQPSVHVSLLEMASMAISVASERFRHIEQKYQICLFAMGECSLPERNVSVKSKISKTFISDSVLDAEGQ